MKNFLLIFLTIICFISLAENYRLTQNNNYLIIEDKHDYGMIHYQDYPEKGQEASYESPKDQKIIKIGRRSLDPGYVPGSDLTQ